MNRAGFALPPLPRLRARIVEDDAAQPTGGLPGTETAFAEHAHAAADGLPHVILLSGGDHPCSRTSYAALRPALIFSAKNGRCRLEHAGGVVQFEADPFAALDALVEHWGMDDVQDLPPLIAGYVAYEAGRAIEKLPATTQDLLNLPDIWLCWPTVLHVFERESAAFLRRRIEWSDETGILPAITAVRDSRAGTGTTAAAEHLTSPAGHGEGSEHPPPDRGFDAESYPAAVQRIREHIYEGDVYQVNLSQRYRFALKEDPFALWIRLFMANPAPFYAWVDAGDHQVLSTSMERFFCTDGTRIETRPIKGTRPRGGSEAEDRRLADELRSSPKDDAELSMIVDLERNDLGKICAAGSVRVAAHKQVELYANVQHLVSVVEGRLLPDRSIGDIFRALFPGGSITGCPKIRAMEIIDAIEPETRHVYTGSVGYIRADGRADFNIAIRTAIVHDGLCHLSVGGGIVYDSDPMDEYYETLHKGRTFFQLAGVRTELD